MEKRELTAGMKILFFGTEHTINKVIDYDVVEVILPNGKAINLWFPNLPGREILSSN